MPLKVGSLSMQSDCTFRDMHLVCQSLEQTIKGTTINKSIAGNAGGKMGPWTAARTSDAEMVTSPNID